MAPFNYIAFLGHFNGVPHAKKETKKCVRSPKNPYQTFNVVWLVRKGLDKHAPPILIHTGPHALNMWEYLAMMSLPQWSCGKYTVWGALVLKITTRWSCSTGTSAMKLASSGARKSLLSHQSLLSPSASPTSTARMGRQTGSTHVK